MILSKIKYVTILISAILLPNFVLFSCKKENKTKEITTSDSIFVSPKRNINSIGYVLTPESTELVKNWTEFQQFDVYITKYFAISNVQALHNASELSKLSSKLKESVKEPLFNEPSTIARFNILESECKRLEDMSKTATIKPEDVSDQIKRILEAYSSVNSKINSLHSIQKMEGEIRLDPDFEKILKEVPKEDLIDKKEKLPVK